MVSKADDLSSIPKIELHLHLDGAVRPQTLIELAQAAGVKLPTTDARKLARWFVPPKKERSLAHFLKKFDPVYPCLSSPEAIERVAYELCEDLALQHVRYFEARFAPSLFVGRKGSANEAVKAALAGLSRGKRAFKIQSGLILCLIRGMKLAAAVQTAEIALSYRSRGVCGIDLAGDESFDDSEYADVFEMAYEQKLPITIHAGEAGPTLNIRRAIEEFHAGRIGHAVKILHDPSLIYDMREQGIGVECCLTSNLLTGAVDDLKSHPFKTLFDKHVLVTLNSDDPLVCGTTLTQEFALAKKAFGLTRADFTTLYKNALAAAFLPEDSKSALATR